MRSQMKRSLVRIMIGLAVAGTILSGCVFAGTGVSGAGSVLLRVVDQLMEPLRTYAPDDSLVVYSYHVNGTGPAGATFDETYTVGGGVISIPDLIAGHWDFYVGALNADGTEFLSGSLQDVLVVDGDQTEAELSLEPTPGGGTLVVEYVWETGIIVTPRVGAVLTPYSGGSYGTGTVLAHSDFVASESSGMTTYLYQGPQAAGYYNLSTTIEDIDPGTALTWWSSMDTVRIMNGMETRVSIAPQSGSVDITITLERQEPLVVTLAVVSGSNPLTSGSDVTVEATITGGTPDPTTGYECTWYLDGLELAGETASTITLGSALDTGRYRLGVVAADGTVLGSQSIELDVISG